jgi:hypothetical protein
MASYARRGQEPPEHVKREAAKAMRGTSPKGKPPPPKSRLRRAIRRRRRGRSKGR